MLSPLRALSRRHELQLMQQVSSLQASGRYGAQQPNLELATKVQGARQRLTARDQVPELVEGTRHLDKIELMSTKQMENEIRDELRQLVLEEPHAAAKAPPPQSHTGRGVLRDEHGQSSRGGPAELGEIDERTEGSGENSFPTTTEDGAEMRDSKQVSSADDSKPGSFSSTGSVDMASPAATCRSAGTRSLERSPLNPRRPASCGATPVSGVKSPLTHSSGARSSPRQLQQYWSRSPGGGSGGSGVTDGEKSPAQVLQAARMSPAHISPVQKPRSMPSSPLQDGCDGVQINFRSVLQQAGVDFSIGPRPLRVKPKALPAWSEERSPCGSSSSGSFERSKNSPFDMSNKTPAASTSELVAAAAASFDMKLRQSKQKGSTQGTPSDAASGSAEGGSRSDRISRASMESLEDDDDPWASFMADLTNKKAQTSHAADAASDSRDGGAGASGAGAISEPSASGPLPPSQAAGAASAKAENPDATLPPPKSSSASAPHERRGKSDGKKGDKSTHDSVKKLKALDGKKKKEPRTTVCRLCEETIKTSDLSYHLVHCTAHYSCHEKLRQLDRALQTFAVRIRRRRARMQAIFQRIETSLEPLDAVLAFCEQVATTSGKSDGSGAGDLAGANKVGDGGKPSGKDGSTTIDPMTETYYLMELQKKADEVFSKLTDPALVELSVQVTGCRSAFLAPPF